MSDSDWFRVRAVLRCAIEVDDGQHAEAGTSVPSRPASTAARAAVRRIDRGDTGLREIARALLDAIGTLEQEVERLRVRLDLADVGIELHSQLMEIGADGLRLERDLDLPPDARVRVWLELPIDGQELVLTTPARVLASLGGTAVVFEDIPTDVRDRIVGFAFQQQAKERRRDREHAAR